MIRDFISSKNDKFGPLSSITILDTGTVTAAPWAGTLAGEFGAEIIKIEPPTGDISRFNPPFLKDDAGNSTSTYWAQDARNKISMTLDFTKPESKEIFARLIKISDIWLESSIPGTYSKKFGITDEWVMEINPKIIIVHVSGFGQTGEPEYVSRASWDMIGQAFSCYCDLNGYDGQEPLRIGPVINDYITAIWALWSALAGYIHAQETGKGQVIDIAQYEVMFRMINSYVLDYLTLGATKTRCGNKTYVHPFSIYPTKDGYIAIAAGGASFSRFMDCIPTLKDKPYKTVVDQMKYGDDIAENLKVWLKDFTTAEAEKILSDANVPCSEIMNIQKASKHPHYLAREDFLEWDDPVGGKVKGYGIVPKFSETPGKVWRGAPRLGQDTVTILKYIGYSEEQIENLLKSGIVSKKK